MKPIAQIKTPQESVNDEYLSVIKIHVTNNQHITTSTLLAELESSKAVVDVFSDSDGFIKVCCAEGTDAKVGSILFEIYTVAGVPEALDSLSLTGNIENDGINPSANSNGVLKPITDQQFSKDALQLIEKNNINISALSHLAFITTRDIEKISTQNKNTGAVKSSAPTQIITSNSTTSSSNKLSPSKKREAEYLQSVNNNGVVSMLSTSVKLQDASGIMNAQSFITTTPLPTIIFEVSRLLKKYQNLNSYYDCGFQKTYSAINIGFAIDINKGLKVCAINNTDALSIENIENQIADLTAKYLDDKLNKEELTNTTFTITDLFNTNTIDFYPLVNINNAAILGISSLQNNSFKINLSFDHRVTNGKEVALFLTDLKSRLEAHFKSASGKSMFKANGISCFKCLRGFEEDLDGKIYFLPALNQKEDGYICSNCLSGY